MINEPYRFDPALQLHNRTVAPNLPEALEPITEYFRDLLDAERDAAAFGVQDDLATSVLFTTFNSEADILPLPLASDGPLAHRRWRRDFQDKARRMYGAWVHKHPQVARLAARATRDHLALCLDVNVFLHTPQNASHYTVDYLSVTQRELCLTFAYHQSQVVKASCYQMDAALIGGVQGIGACLYLQEATV